MTKLLITAGFVKYSFSCLGNLRKKEREGGGREGGMEKFNTSSRESLLLEEIN